jgi:hypothetical protein
MLKANEGTEPLIPERQTRREQLMMRIDELLSRMLHLREMHGQVDAWLVAGEMHWFQKTNERLVDLYSREQRVIAKQLDEALDQFEAEEKVGIA